MTARVQLTKIFPSYEPQGASCQDDLLGGNASLKGILSLSLIAISE
jgi:hypothetical protein